MRVESERRKVRGERREARARGESERREREVRARGESERREQEKKMVEERKS